MRLRTRLFLTILLLCGVVAGALAVIVQRAWRIAEEQRFEEESQAAWASLRQQLEEAPKRLDAQLRPHCASNPLIDSALVGLLSGTLEERWIGLQSGIPNLMRSMQLDGLILRTPQGTVLAGTWPSGDLTSVAALPALPSRYLDEPEPGFLGSCSKSERGQSLELLGFARLAPLVASASRKAGVEFRLSDFPQAATPQLLVQEQSLPALGGRRVVATRSARSLASSLRHLNAEVATAFLVACLLSFVFALGLSRRLSRPIQRFAARTYEAARGEAHAVEDESTPELAEAAQAFNRTLESLRDLRLQLEATERIAARREVARRVAHEVKNPLSPIRTSIETLVRLKKSGSEHFDEFFDETAQVVLAEVHRLNRLVNHFSRYANLPSPRLQTMSMVELCRSIAQFYAAEAPHLRFVGLLGADSSLVNAEEVDPVLLTGDPEQIRQVVTNLVKNALEATAHLERAEVVIELRRTEEAVLLSVSDNGPGVEQPADLFEPYRTTKESGTGLGLPIAQRIAVEHGGDLTYRSGAMGGAHFELRLPWAGPPRLNRREQQTGL